MVTEIKGWTFFLRQGSSLDHMERCSAFDIHRTSPTDQQLCIYRVWGNHNMGINLWCSLCQPLGPL